MNFPRSQNQWYVMKSTDFGANNMSSNKTDRKAKATPAATKTAKLARIKCLRNAPRCSKKVMESVVDMLGKSSL